MEKMKIRLMTAALLAFAALGVIGVFGFQFSGWSTEATALASEDTKPGPVKGMITMIDLGAKECVPCKMMIPVMENVERRYKGKAAILFIDVWKDKEPAARFGIKAIPTQIFFNTEGDEVYRHRGFMSEAEIDKVFDRMGLKIEGE
jgi:thioredoxin 1